MGLLGLRLGEVKPSERLTILEGGGVGEGAIVLGERDKVLGLGLSCEA